MISICIPAFDFVVVETVDALLRCASECELEVEVIVFDDLSDPAFRERNRALQSRQGVVYLELVEKMGRSRIRNCMADYAQGDWLLFMDGDMGLVDAEYLNRFHDVIATGECDVVCGGIDFGSCPEALDQRLRWHVEQRRLRAYRRCLETGRISHITTGNFCIRKSVLEKVRFNDSLRGYGQEDQLLWFDLLEQGARVVCIDNPTQHMGGESNAEFLRKSQQLLLNQVRVWNSSVGLRPGLRRASPRMNAAHILRRGGLAWMVVLWFRFWRPMVFQWLSEGSLGMLGYDFFLLGYLLQAMGMDNLQRMMKRADGV